MLVANSFSPLKSVPLSLNAYNYGLTDWWLSTFTEEGRKEIQAVHPTLVVGDNKDIIVSERAYPEFTTGWLENGLSSLAIEFIRSKEMDIAARLLAKAEETGGAKLLNRHFTYQQMAQAYYRHRNDDPEALDRAIDSCEKQIHLGPEAAKVFLAEDPKDYLPAHHGFQQLAIIRKREKDYAEAIRLCKEAMARDGAANGRNVSLDVRTGWPNLNSWCCFAQCGIKPDVRLRRIKQPPHRGVPVQLIAQSPASL